eukprot:403330933
MDSQKFIIEQLLDQDDSIFYEQQQERKALAQEAARMAAIESNQNNLSGVGSISRDNSSEYQGFQQLMPYPAQPQNQHSKHSENPQINPFQNFSNFGTYGQINANMRPIQMMYCCSCKQQIIHEGTSTRLLNSYTNEEVNIHYQCYEQVNVKGQAGIQNLLQSMIPKFSLSFSTPNHSSKQQIVGQDICLEIRFINPNTMNIINSFMNIIIPPLYDGVSGSWFCQQSLYNQFSISTSVILIDLTISIPGLHGKKARGMINLFEILPLQSTPIICLQIPVSSRNPMYQQSNITDIFFLTFNVQLQKDEYLISNLQFQVEFKDSGLFSFPQAQMIMQNQPNGQLQYPMQMNMQGMDPRAGQMNQQIYQHMVSPGMHQDGYGAQNIGSRVSSKKKKQALQGGIKFKSQNNDKCGNNPLQSAQLGPSTFQANSNPFYPNMGQQILENTSQFPDSSSTMSSSQNAQERSVINQQNLAYQRPLQFNSQVYKTQGLDIYKAPNQNGKNKMYRENGLSPNQINPVMSPIDSQSEQTLSSHGGMSGTSKRKKGSDKMAMFQGKFGKSNGNNMPENESSPNGSYVSSQTDKSNKSKIETSSQQDLEIPHLNNMYEYLISQKGSRHMQLYIKKETNQEQINKIIDRIQNDCGKLMIDKYGNYFCQNLLRTVSPENRLKIITFLSPEFVQVSCHVVGTHSMQRLLEIITLPEEKQVIFNAIHPQIETMALHVFGNYVLALAFSVLDQPQIEIIIERLIPLFYQLTLDKSGICIANKMITQTKNPVYIQSIVQILCDKLVQIIQDPFGNYAITQALSSWDNETICGEILKKFKENFVQLAIQNFSQQVLEKCVERANQNLIQDFFEILQRENVMKSMIKNSHSIFIVQKIYNRLVSNDDKEILRSLIEKNLIYVSDKMIKSRCLNILQEQSPSTKMSYKEVNSPIDAYYDQEGNIIEASSFNRNPYQNSNSGPGSPMLPLPK